MGDGSLLQGGEVLHIEQPTGEYCLLISPLNPEEPPLPPDPPDIQSHERERQKIISNIHKTENVCRQLRGYTIESNKNKIESEIVIVTNQIAHTKDCNLKTTKLKQDKEQEVRSQLNVIRPLEDKSKLMKGQLRFTDELKLTNALKDKNYTYEHTSLSINEERVILSDIAKLEKNKKDLREYNKFMDEISNERAKLSSLKSEKEDLFHSVSELQKKQQSETRKWEELQVRHDNNQRQDTELRTNKQIAYDELACLRRSLHVLDSNFNDKRRQYDLYIATQTAEQYYRHSHSHTHTQTLDRVDPMIILHLSTCNNLQQYLNNLIVTDTVTRTISPSHTSSGPLEDANTDESVGRFLPQKKKPSDDQQSKSKRSQKKSQKLQRKHVTQVNKPLKHTSDVYQSFGLFSMVPPSTISVISATLEQLKQIQMELECSVIPVLLKPDDTVSFCPSSSGIGTSLCSSMSGLDQDQDLIRDNHHDNNHLNNTLTADKLEKYLVSQCS